MSFTVRDLLILARIPGIGSHRLRALVQFFKDPRALSHAPLRHLVQVEGIERKSALAIGHFFQSHAIRAAEREADLQLLRLQRTGGRIIALWDEEYPSALKKIYDPPPLLFLRGALRQIDGSSIAVVGTRHPSSYGSLIAERFAAELARRGVTVVSGLARGIDTHAHAAALRAGGRSVAIIGSGIDVIYPAENKTLAARIEESGAIVSEYEMGTKPDAVNFPRRNRIISGMTLGTLIVETGIGGGAMITASTALDQNREVFAIPSALGEKGPSGTNRLIKEGKALLTESVDDILAELGPRLRGIAQQRTATERIPPEGLSLFERKVYDAVEEEPLHIDQLASRTGFVPGEALVCLLSLEFKGLVRQLAGKRFVKI